MSKFDGANIKDMYRETSLDRYEYVRMPLKLLLDDKKKPSLAMFAWRFYRVCMVYCTSAY
jgi:hypothetical protein